MASDQRNNDDSGLLSVIVGLVALVGLSALPGVIGIVQVLGN